MFAIWAEGHAVDGAPVSVKAVLFSAAVGVPDANGLVLAPRCHPLTVRRPGDRGYFVRVPRQGAAFLIDATQHVGVPPLDVTRLDPDFVIFPTYKWLIGPYGRAFLYVAKRHQDGVPLEQTSYGRRDVRAENDVYFKDTNYVASARRFDMGERDHFISMEMAAIGMEMMAEWGDAAVAARLGMLTARIADRISWRGASLSR